MSCKGIYVWLAFAAMVCARVCVCVCVFCIFLLINFTGQLFSHVCQETLLQIEVGRTEALRILFVVEGNRETDTGKLTKPAGALGRAALCSFWIWSLHDPSKMVGHDPSKMVGHDPKSWLVMNPFFSRSEGHSRCFFLRRGSFRRV